MKKRRLSKSIPMTPALPDSKKYELGVKLTVVFIATCRSIIKRFDASKFETRGDGARKLEYIFRLSTAEKILINYFGASRGLIEAIEARLDMGVIDGEAERIYRELRRGEEARLVTLERKIPDDILRGQNEPR